MYNINRIRFIAIYFHTGGDFSLLFTLLKYSYIIYVLIARRYNNTHYVVGIHTVINGQFSHDTRVK